GLAVVEDDVQRLLALGTQPHHRDRHLADAQPAQDLQPGVPADDVAGEFVPDQRLDQAELAQAGRQLLVRLVAGPQAVPRGLLGRFHGVERKDADLQACDFVFLLSHLISPVGFSSPGGSEGDERNESRTARASCTFIYYGRLKSSGETRPAPPSAPLRFRLLIAPLRHLWYQRKGT